MQYPGHSGYPLLPDALQDFMEKIFGKRIMKEVDTLLAEKQEGV